VPIDWEAITEMSSPIAQPTSRPTLTDWPVKSATMSLVVAGRRRATVRVAWCATKAIATITDRLPERDERGLRKPAPDHGPTDVG
jgi:hypothetical protein